MLANCVTAILHPGSRRWGWAVSSLKVFSSDCCSNQLPTANCAFAWLDLLLYQPLISLKPPSWKTESFTGSAGITFSCGVLLQKSKWFLIRSLPSTLLFHRPPLLYFHYPLRSCCAAGWLPLQHLHLVPPSALCLGSINCSSNLIILICNHFAPLAYGRAQTKRSLLRLGRLLVYWAQSGFRAERFVRCQLHQNVGGKLKPKEITSILRKHPTFQLFLFYFSTCQLLFKHKLINPPPRYKMKYAALEKWANKQ